MSQQQNQTSTPSDSPPDLTQTQNLDSIGDSGGDDFEASLSAEEKAQWASMQGDGTGVALEPDPAAGQQPQQQTQQAPAQVNGQQPGQQPPAQQAPAAPNGQAPNGHAAGENEDNDDGKDEVTVAPDRPEPKRINYGKHKRIMNRVTQERDTLNQRAQTLEQQNQQLIADRARLDERMALLAEALQTPRQQPGQQPQEDPEPDPNEDIIAHQKWMGRELKRMGQAQQQQTQQQQQRDTAQTEEAEITGYYRQDVTAFAQMQPDFAHAYNFLMQNRDAELQAFGYTDPQERAKLIRAEEREIVKLANTQRKQGMQGVSAAQRIYALAKGRGYTPLVAAAPADPAAGQQPPAQQQQPAPGSLSQPAQQPAQQQAPAQPPAAPQTPPAQQQQQPNVMDMLAQIQKGMQGGTSLSNGGGAPQVPTSAEQLANMSDEAFGALLDRLGDEGEKLVLGT